MLAVAATIPDAAERDQFADRLAHKARVTEGVMRDEIREGGGGQRKRKRRRWRSPLAARVRPAEQGLLWALAHRPVEGLAARGAAGAEDLDGIGGGGGA